MTTEVEETKGTAPTTLLRARGRVFNVEPLDADVLQAVSTVKHRLRSSDDNGCHLNGDIEYLTTADPVLRQQLGDHDIPLLHFEIGLESVVRNVLKSKGFNVEHTGAWPQSLSEPDVDVLQNLNGIDRPLLELVHEQSSGLIRYGRKIDRARLIAQVALAWPEISIAVAVKKRCDVDDLVSQLNRYDVDAFGITGGRDSSQRPRVVVGTFQSLLGAACAFLPRREIVIACDAIESLGEVGQQVLQCPDSARLYGMIPSERQIAPYDEDQLRSYFGFHEISIVRHGQTERRVDVAWERIAGGPRISRRSELIDVIRKGVWHHPVRNRHIARLAAGFIANDRELLGRTYPTVAEAMPERDELHVIVFVEGVEHALALAKHLPGWPLTVAADVQTTGLSAADRTVLETAHNRPQATGAQIVTASALSTVDLSAVDVLIRADAGVGDPVFAATDLVSGNWIEPGKQGRMLLVDFHDRHHPKLRKRSRLRKQAYQAHGWYAAGIDPVEERVNRFLAKRPGHK
ncbi:MAG: hypothetical protein DWQ31_18250 [Planctomycetota bacterium]|nr:MAG: hypothetical protein DWQ31_18250 [Planctomycetota bacterium]REJ87306.1 MAG: hypothetical protein DWQ35_21590 [Planctomycetota bacterium]REK22681.1 MAG: hypothetical protein DWQ42_16655 [Planctomycetota bacterium]REK42486.1 MAG: hypothetical protein DWQ46_12935 [Planctomycetota bacterium]